MGHFFLSFYMNKIQSIVFALSYIKFFIVQPNLNFTLIMLTCISSLLNGSQSLTYDNQVIDMHIDKMAFFG